MVYSPGLMIDSRISLASCHGNNTVSAIAFRVSCQARRKLSVQKYHMGKLNTIINKLEYQIELVSQLATVIAFATIYGIIEAKFIPTDKMELPLLGRFSYYHVGLLALMAVGSLSLATAHIQWLLTDKKKYVLLMCLAALPVSLMVEDIAWFVTMWRPIARDEWTMIKPGLGVFVGFTWIPLWYIIVTIFSTTLYYIANKLADKGYRAFREINRTI